jgi:hypothetical protein
VTQTLHDQPVVISETATLPDSASSSTPLLLLTLLVVLAAILRLIATHNDLWLDEIISLRIANAVKTPWQIFTAVHNDNNHYLNTLYLYFLKNHDYPSACRYLSVVCGVALVPAGYWLLVRRSKVEAVILAGLLACSYPLIHFSSEARGYSGVLLGSMLACTALARWMDHQERKERSLLLGLIYGMALVLAIASHLTACLIWFPLALGSLIALADRPGRLRWIALWAALNLPPASVLAALYVLDLRFLTQLGGQPMTVMQGLGRLLALSLSWPTKDAATVWILAVPLLALTIWQLNAEWKMREPLSIFLSLIYLTTLLCALRLRPTFFSPRYFLVILPFVYVSVAMLLARLVRTRAGRLTLAAVLALFVGGQARLYTKFLQVGRGQLTAALNYMVMRTPSTPLKVASDQDFRLNVELGYYAPRVLGNRQILIVPGESAGVSQPDWYILHSEGYEPPGPARFNIPGQPTWYRAAYFGASELSGQAWTIYTHQPFH